MGVILAIGNAIWEHEVGTRFQVYLPWDEAVDSAFFSGFLSFWSYIIILNTVVPISLYVRYVLSLPLALQGDETLDKEYVVLSTVATSCGFGLWWSRNYIDLLIQHHMLVQAYSGKEVQR